MHDRTSQNGVVALGAKIQIIIVGDIGQSDLPATGVSGLADAASRLKQISGVALHEFSDKDIVRPALVRDILRAYETR